MDYVINNLHKQMSDDGPWLKELVDDLHFIEPNVVEDEVHSTVPNVEKNQITTDPSPSNTMRNIRKRKVILMNFLDNPTGMI